MIAGKPQPAAPISEADAEHYSRLSPLRKVVQCSVQHRSFAVVHAQPNMCDNSRIRHLWSGCGILALPCPAANGCTCSTAIFARNT